MYGQSQNGTNLYRIITEESQNATEFGRCHSPLRCAQARLAERPQARAGTKAVSISAGSRRGTRRWMTSNAIKYAMPAMTNTMT